MLKDDPASVCWHPLPTDLVSCLCFPRWSGGLQSLEREGCCSDRGGAGVDEVWVMCGWKCGWNNYGSPYLPQDLDLSAPPPEDGDDGDGGGDGSGPGGRSVAGGVTSVNPGAIGRKAVGGTGGGAQAGKPSSSADPKAGPKGAAGGGAGGGGDGDGAAAAAATRNKSLFEELDEEGVQEDPEKEVLAFEVKADQVRLGEEEGGQILRWRGGTRVSAKVGEAQMGQQRCEKCEGWAVIWPLPNCRAPGEAPRHPPPHSLPRTPPPLSQPHTPLL